MWFKSGHRTYKVAYIKKIEKFQIRATQLITCIKTSQMHKDLVTSINQHYIEEDYVGL